MKMIYQKPETEILLTLIDSSILGEQSEGILPIGGDMSNESKTFDEGEIPANSSSSLWED